MIPVARARAARFLRVHQLSLNVQDGAGAGAAPKVRTTTTTAATTMAATSPEVHTLASTVLISWEMRPVKTAGEPRPR